MPTFYFDVIVRGKRISDYEGSVLPDFVAARHEAIEDARSIMSNAVIEGLDVSSRVIEIRSESGNVLAAIPFSDAIRPEE